MIRWILQNSGAWRRRRIDQFWKNTRQCADSQRQVLMECLRRSKDTAFGRDHGFRSVASVEQFRHTVPIASYEDLRPYIDREVAGERGALLNPQDRTLMFAKTSGTTGRAKLIPVTESSGRAYLSAFQVWVDACFEDHPQGMDGYILPIVGAEEEGTTPGGVPTGAISGLLARRQSRITRSLYAAPRAVHNIPQASIRYYTLMRIALNKDVTLMSTANPSTLLLLARLADERKEALLRDLHDGTLTGGEALSGAMFRALQPYLERNPARARELERIASRRGGLYPVDYWPNLSLITCWKGGPLKLFLQGLPEYYGHVPVRDIGLLASEGRFTIPLSDMGAGGLLNTPGAFYEFVPESGRASLAGCETLLAHELERGRSYRIIVTSSNGLCRYDMHDVVQVEGFEGSTPVLGFLNKGQHIASVTGEKVSEYQAVTAVFEGAGNKDSTRFVVCPAWDSVPYYTVVMEAGDARKVENWPEKLSAIDGRLCQLNSEYASKRESGRVGAMRLTLVSSGSLAGMDSLHGHNAQFKPVYLKTEIDYHQRFSPIGQICALGEPESSATVG